MRRRAILLVLSVFVAMLVFVVAILLVDRNVIVDDRAYGSPAPYNTMGRWPGDRPVVCLEDHTTAAGNSGAGFPVKQAAAEYAGLPITFVVEIECVGYVNIVQVVTINDRELSFSARFDADRRDDGQYAAGRIELNLAQAFRMTPRGWRMALVHELGHAAGLDHTFEAGSVMHPLDYDSGLTDTDREQIRGLYDPDGIL